MLLARCAEVGKRAEFAQRHMQIFSKKKKNRDTHAHVHVSLLTNLLCIITITLAGVGDTLQDRRVVPWDDDRFPKDGGEKGGRTAGGRVAVLFRRGRDTGWPAWILFLSSPGDPDRQLQRLQILFLCVSSPVLTERSFLDASGGLRWRNFLICTGSFGFRGEAFNSHWKKLLVW